MVVRYFAALRPRRNEKESGDGYYVDATPERALVVVVDGLGHGEPAAAAARAAIDVARQHRFQPLSDIARRCHEALAPTRGGVIGMGLFDARHDTLAWLGVGNVGGVIVRGGGVSFESLVPRGGLLGRSLPHLGLSVKPVSPGDTLIVTTDGIRWQPGVAPLPADEPERTARHLVAAHALDDDDALALVVRYLGMPRASAG